MDSAAYVHALNGRLRIKIPGLKGNPAKAQELEHQFSLLTGMQQVSANPVTGSLLLIYNSHALTQDKIFAALQESGYIRTHSSRQDFSHPASSSHGVFEKITGTLASGLMELALTRLVSALI